jgi:hypothetical protein
MWRKLVAGCGVQNSGETMVEIKIEGDKAAFEIEGWDKLWSLRSRLEIPLDHIKGAYIDPQPAMGWFQGLKVAGTDFPNVFRAGTFYQDGGFVFWDVHHPENTIVVELDHERFQKLVIEVADPVTAANKIQTAISRRRN